MSRRQALGVISNQYTNNQNVFGNQNLKSHPLKPQTNNIIGNNENSFVQTKKEVEFEIFQEECEINKFAKQEMKASIIDKENFATLETKEKNVFVNEEFSREIRKEMMDSSVNSPMVLDDTIKFSSSDSSELEIDSVEDSEEAKQIRLIEERENLLVNCDEYKDDILSYMRQEEQKNRPKANYMKKQQDITSSMRSILIDWLVEVSEEYKLNTETLYLAVNYTDRFLSQMSVLRGKLQLVGTASMYIAAKYEEISPPDVNEFVYITDDTYTKKQVLRMEHLLLKVLDFRMNTPTTNNFLTHYLRFLKINGLITCNKVENLARYLIELTLIESDTFLNFLPSQIAASAIYLSLCTLEKKWTKPIAELIGYDFELKELEDCISALHKTMQTASSLPQQAIQEKYKSHRFNGVSLLEAPKMLPFN